MDFSFSNSTYAALLALFAAIFGVGYPLIIQAIGEIDKKYDSTLLLKCFEDEPKFKPLPDKDSEPKKEKKGLKIFGILVLILICIVVICFLVFTAYNLLNQNIAYGVSIKSLDVSHLRRSAAP